MTKIFISHASEDKDAIARPLAMALLREGLDVWYDEFTLTLGDNLRRSIEVGLQKCDFGVVVLSPAFFKKEWPKQELDGLFSKELEKGKTILPVWHQVDKERVLKFSSLMANRIAVDSSEGIDSIVIRILTAISKEQSTQLRPSHAQRTPDVIYTIHQGSEIEKILRKMFTERLDVDREQIQSLSISVYDDGSGMDDNNSFLTLRDGSKIVIREIEVFEALNELSPILSSRFEPIAWAVNDYIDERDTEVTTREICVMRLRKNQSKRSNILRKRLNAVLSNPHEIFGDVPHQFRDSLFYRGPVKEMLDYLLISERAFGIIESLIFEDRDPSDRASFLIASRLLDYVEKKQELLHSAQVKNLLERLKSEPEPLNDYHRNRINKFLEKIIVKGSTT